MPQHIKEPPRRYCAHCGARLIRKRYNGRLEDFGVFMRRKFCDKTCMVLGHQNRAVSKQGHLWRARRHRKSECERCGSTDRLHVHHRDNDWRNDDPTNLETLCATCHLTHHWAEDGRRKRAQETRRVPLAAIEELHGFAEEAQLTESDQEWLAAIIRTMSIDP